MPISWRDYGYEAERRKRAVQKGETPEQRMEALRTGREQRMEALRREGFQKGVRQSKIRSGRYWGGSAGDLGQKVEQERRRQFEENQGERQKQFESAQRESLSRYGMMGLEAAHLGQYQQMVEQANLSPDKKQRANALKAAENFRKQIEEQRLGRAHSMASQYGKSFTEFMPAGDWQAKWRKALK